MTPTVVGDGAVAAGGEEEHLILKSVRTQRPAVAKDHCLSGSPVIEIDLRAVLRLDCTRLDCTPVYRLRCWRPHRCGGHSGSRESGHAQKVPASQTAFIIINISIFHLFILNPC